MKEVTIWEGKCGNIKIVGVQVVKRVVQEATTLTGFEHVLAQSSLSFHRSMSFKRSGSMRLSRAQDLRPRVVKLHNNRSQ